MTRPSRMRVSVAASVVPTGSGGFRSPSPTSGPSGWVGSPRQCRAGWGGSGTERRVDCARPAADPVGMNELPDEPVTEVQQRLSYLNLTAADCELLDGACAQRSSATPLASSPPSTATCSPSRPTRELLRDPGVKERLLVKQREYLLSLANASFDADFVAQRRRIGEVHQRIGLEPRWYLGAYALYLSLLTPVIHDAYASDPERAMRTVVALQKLLMFDAQIALESYIDGARERARVPDPRARGSRVAGSRAISTSRAPSCGRRRRARGLRRSWPRSPRWSPGSRTRSARRWA